MPGTRKLGRTTAHRRAMLRAMVTYLIENGRIETTVTRAKEVRAMAEKKCLAPLTLESVYEVTPSTIPGGSVVDILDKKPVYSRELFRK